MDKGQERFYRLFKRQSDLKFFQIMVRETDLDIGVPVSKFSPGLRDKTRAKVISLRRQLEEYMDLDPKFAPAMTPYKPLPSAPDMPSLMAKAAAKAGVGPMAAVAGAFAEAVGRFISLYSNEFIVENGGDIYLRSSRTRNIGIYAGESPFNNRIALAIQPYQTPLGICTSSGVVGHSLSLGNADAVIVLAPSVPLADAVATAAANLVQKPADVQKAVEFALGISGIRGALAILGDKLSAAGEIEINPV